MVMITLNQLLMFRNGVGDDNVRVILGHEPHTETLFTNIQTLSSLSDVFHKMLESPFIEGCAKEIAIPDIDPRLVIWSS